MITALIIANIDTISWFEALEMGLHISCCSASQRQTVAFGNALATFISSSMQSSNSSSVAEVIPTAQVKYFSWQNP